MSLHLGHHGDSAGGRGGRSGRGAGGQVRGRDPGSFGHRRPPCCDHRLGLLRGGHLHRHRCTARRHREGLLENHTHHQEEPP